MDEQSAETKEEEVMGDGIGESKIEKLVYQNKVDEEMKGVYSRDKVKHNERSDQLLSIQCIYCVGETI